jgi:predicted Fe-Mo cluster-binding NifX family protein
LKLLIPTVDANGSDSKLSGHFGRAPYYAVADTATGAVQVVPNPSVSHGHGECVPASDALGTFDAVVCQGIGAGAINRLAAAGVRVYVHEGADVASAVSAFGSGAVRLAGDNDGCGGSGGCGHHH